MEMWIRFWPFLAVFSIMVTWEFLSPRRILSQRRQERWPTNLGLTLLNVVLVWALVGAVAYMAATFAAEQQVGLLHWVSAPFWFTVPVTILVLDFRPLHPAPSLPYLPPSMAFASGPPC